jgi:hypothetical protein
MTAWRPAKYRVIDQFYMPGNRPHGVVELGALLRKGRWRRRDGNEQN